MSLAKESLKSTEISRDLLLALVLQKSAKEKREESNEVEVNVKNILAFYCEIGFLRLIVLLQKLLDKKIYFFLVFSSENALSKRRCKNCNAFCVFCSISRPLAFVQNDFYSVHLTGIRMRQSIGEGQRNVL